MAVPLFFFFFFLLISSPALTSPSPNPFTEKAALIRYWNRKIPNNLPHPSFLLSKLTPLSASDATTFFNLAASDPSLISSHLTSFCSAAGLLCPTDLTPSLSSHPRDTSFTNYGTGSADGLSSFKNYSDNINVPLDTFRRYGRDSAGHDDKFSFYDHNGNAVTANFTSYGTNTAGGTDDLSAYDEFSNVPDLKFTNYAAEGTGREGRFSQYSVRTNVGNQSFNSYGKNGNGGTSDFSSYANNSNVIGSAFTHYGEEGNAVNETFSSYGENGNVPENNFRSYGEEGNGGNDTFSSYRDQSNVGDTGDNFFTSYEKSGNEGTADFTNYGNSTFPSSDNFKGYGEGSFNDLITFKEYFADNTSFKSYAKTGIEFKEYHNSSSSSTSPAIAAMKQAAAKRFVEPGKFFRERNLKKGTVMPMPDIRDRMPPRSFLPRSIAGKILFSAVAVDGIFHILPDTAMGKAVDSTIADCERAPSRGETKRCAASVEDMIDFAVAVLGDDIEVRSTANTKGSKGNILIGNVRGVNGGKVTKSVSCHQSLFPYMVYYCHSVPRVRVYVAEILAVDTKEKINQGVAICHIDTSDWSPTHGAFVALGPGPGKIEVCHWIFEGDMTWTVADRA
ncbi:BURP domain-containing protein 12-like [Phalaenopsis equestris]|uniref:BURP domain-containing protein 12-like n=1 Tax=Phalaenopsis equestris TaxID=78828 RepID=UPI0009E5E2E7|nr:BURP domain-containing protein 12-like [Phalaenopsis equestris]